MYRFIIIFFCCLSVVNLFGQSLAGITGKPDTSFSVYSAFLNTKKTNPEAVIVNEIHTDFVKEDSNIAYCKTGDSSLARLLLLDAFYPATNSNQLRPAILIIHGGGWRAGNKNIHHAMAQSLAALGYVCFTPEYRLSTEALYPAAVYDIKSAIRWIRENAKKYHIDVNKIAVAGHSAGGELAAFMGSTNGMKNFEGDGCNLNYSSNVNAVIDIDGLLAFIHPESGEGDDSKRTSAATNWFGYSKTQNPDLWKQGSPLTHAGKHTPPTLFINSNVTRMHAGREDYIKILSGYNIYTEVQSFDAPHSFCLFEPWFNTTIQYMDSFLKKIFSK